jgi:hypothetical protein
LHSRGLDIGVITADDGSVTIIKGGAMPPRPVGCEHRDQRQNCTGDPDDYQDDACCLDVEAMLFGLAVTAKSRSAPTAMAIMLAVNPPPISPTSEGLAQSCWDVVLPSRTSDETEARHVESGFGKRRPAAGSASVLQISGQMPGMLDPGAAFPVL